MAVLTWPLLLIPYISIGSLHIFHISHITSTTSRTPLTSLICNLNLSDLAYLLSYLHQISSYLSYLSYRINHISHTSRFSHIHFWIFHISQLVLCEGCITGCIKACITGLPSHPAPALLAAVHRRAVYRLWFRRSCEVEVRISLPSVRRNASSSFFCLFFAEGS